MTTRVVNIRHQMFDPGNPDHVYVGQANAWYGLKGSMWANPFRVGSEAERPAVIAWYQRCLLQEWPDLVEDLHELRGRTLYCF